MNILSWWLPTLFLMIHVILSFLSRNISLNACRQLTCLSFNFLSSSLNVPIVHRSALFPNLLSVQLLSFELTPVCLSFQTYDIQNRTQPKEAEMEQLKAVKMASFFLHSA